MEWTYWKFILVLLLAAIAGMCTIILIGKVIEKVYGKKKAKGFTDFVDNVVDFLAGLTGSV